MYCRSELLLKLFVLHFDGKQQVFYVRMIPYAGEVALLHWQ